MLRAEAFSIGRTTPHPSQRRQASKKTTGPTSSGHPAAGRRTKAKRRRAKAKPHTATDTSEAGPRESRGRQRATTQQATGHRQKGRNRERCKRRGWHGRIPDLRKAGGPHSDKTPRSEGNHVPNNAGGITARGGRYRVRRLRTVPKASTHITGDTRGQGMPAESRRRSMIAGELAGEISPRAGMRDSCVSETASTKRTRAISMSARKAASGARPVRKG